MAVAYDLHTLPANSHQWNNLLDMQRSQGKETKIPLEMHPTGHSARNNKTGALPTDAGNNVPSLILRNVELDMLPQVETGAGSLQAKVSICRSFELGIKTLVQYIKIVSGVTVLSTTSNAQDARLQAPIRGSAPRNRLCVP